MPCSHWSADVSARASYRSLVEITGPGFLLLSFIARLPSAMAPLGTIMLVVSVTGSYAKAGAATAALGVGAALGGPVAGRLTDRFGQRTVGLFAAAINAFALASVLGAVLAGAGMAAVTALAALTGLATPQIGPLVRLRWAAMLRARHREHLTPVAMSYEGAADEASFVAGPALVGVFALTGLVALPLLIAVGLMLAAIVFAVHRTVPPVAAPGTASGSATPSDRRSLGALGVLITAMLGIGVVFGATQTGVAAFAESIGHGSATGLIYAVLGAGSVIAGLSTAWLPSRFGLARRLPVFAATIAFGSLALLTVRSLATAILAMAALGVTVAPLLITVYALAERIAPAHRAGMIMTLLASGTVGGVALGAGVAGPLAGSYGYPGAFAVPIVAGVVTTTVAALGTGRVRAAMRTSATQALSPTLTRGRGTRMRRKLTARMTP